MTDLSALIRDIEAATGPDRALDERVALALGWTRAHDGRNWWESPKGQWFPNPPQFTGSLDAARGTFPDDIDYTMINAGDWRRYVRVLSDRFAECRGNSATEPLAMCAASMRLKEREGA